jgi:hypothetical protein
LVNAAATLPLAGDADLRRNFCLQGRNQTVATQEWDKLDAANAWCAGFDQHPRRHLCPFDPKTDAHAYAAYWEGWNQAEAESAEATKAA